MTFEQVARMYNMEYEKAKTKAELINTLATNKQASLKLIEVFTDREENVKQHRLLWTRINEVIEQWLDSL